MDIVTMTIPIILSLIIIISATASIAGLIGIKRPLLISTISACILCAIVLTICYIIMR